MINNNLWAIQNHNEELTQEEINQINVIEPEILNATKDE